MRRSVTPRSALLVTFVISAVLALPAHVKAAPIVTVSPGTIAGYIPLDLFGGTSVFTPLTDGLVNIGLAPTLFASESWTQASAAENGFLILGGGANGTAINQTLPNPAAPNNVLAPYWTDLQSTTVMFNVLTDGVGVWSVIEWRGTTVASNVNVAFQVWLGHNGVEEIAFSYGNPQSLSSAGVTIGAETKTGQYGAMWSGPLQDLTVQTRDIPVPEPASAAMIGLGLLALARRMRSTRARG